MCHGHCWPLIRPLQLHCSLCKGRITVNKDPWHQRKTQNIHIVFVRILFSGNTNNLVRKTKSKPGVLLEFLQGAREDSRVEKVRPLFFTVLLSITINKNKTWIWCSLFLLPKIRFTIFVLIFFFLDIVFILKLNTVFCLKVTAIGFKTCNWHNC